MSLISMAIYDTGANQRAPILKRCLDSVLKTVDFSRHRICLVINSSTEESTEHIFQFLEKVGEGSEAIWMQENVGTAKAINKAWLTRQPGEHAVKMDDDVVLYDARWADKMEDAINRDPKLGIIGLKRKDLEERPDHPQERFRSVFRAIPHEPGQMCVVVEQVEHVMGTCQMFSAALLDKIGYFYQPGLYGFDDSLAAVRCRKAGFYSAFYPNIEIDHIDNGTTPYQKWKGDKAMADMPEYNRLKDGYLSGAIPIWYGPNGEQEVVQFRPQYEWTAPKYSTR